ncbi:hypothetical protein [Cellulomonas sp. NS3]|uniref:hypothetical protein n=1 Tax=Cellulomonas sp. NS3 TaxID=2973977 RepID=UPI0021623CFE|nr:hypothetical protein [Cellulomonas sp. NS3]
MSVVTVAVLLGIIVVLLMRSRQVRAEIAVVCILFGLVLGATPAGPAVRQFLEFIGEWIWTLLQTW